MRRSGEGEMVCDQHAPRTAVYGCSAALTTPAPLWGGIQSGGRKRLYVTNTKFSLRIQGSGRAELPPPYIPPPTGEGVADVALYTPFDGSDRAMETAR